MVQLFNKVACFTDIHLGLKGDSRQHNIDAENFIYWFLDEAKEFGADTFIFLGDWHHNRARINVSTLNYTVSNIERICQSFDKTFWIMGNHDLYYRDKREINSVEFGRNLTNMKIISEPFQSDPENSKDNVVILPWLVENEWKKVKEVKCKYMFGHFEIPNFKMNAMVDMPDTGELHADDFVHPEYVFSGHFHKRQRKDNIIYIGNCFPHNFADAWDEDRGAMFMEWDGEPIFKSWPDAPKYKKCRLSQLLEDPYHYLDKHTYLRVEMDLHPTYEETNYIKDELIANFEPRDFAFLPITGNPDDDPEFHGELNFESVESVVLSHLRSIESNNIDNELLVKIFQSL